MLAVLVGRFLYSQHKKKKTAAWLDQHPNAVKVYLKAYKLAWN
ncbi:MAG: hypothetical protein Q4B28_03385 [bacterium]|nr:hypothetical protein [bacterium]